MHDLLDALLRDFGSHCAVVDAKEGPYVERIKKKLSFVEEAVLKLENKYKERTTRCERTQVEYYKFLRPRLYKWEIYFQKVVEVETSMPIGSVKEKTCHFKKHLKSLSKFYIRQRLLFEYVRSGATHFDTTYFNDKHLNNDFVSSVIATEMVESYLNERIIYIRNPSPPIKEEIVKPVLPELKWTDKQTALVELIYALHSSECFNNGNASLKSITELFEATLNINLGEYRRTFQDIKLRNQHDKFLQHLSTNLKKKIDEEL